jgi:hypothetical protein
MQWRDEKAARRRKTALAAVGKTGLGLRQLKKALFLF